MADRTVGQVNSWRAQTGDWVRDRLGGRVSGRLAGGVSSEVGCEQADRRFGAALF